MPGVEILVSVETNNFLAVPHSGSWPTPLPPRCSHDNRISDEVEMGDLLPSDTKEDFISADGPTVTLRSSQTPPRRYAQAAIKQCSPMMQGALMTAPILIVAVSCAAIPASMILYDDDRLANWTSIISAGLAARLPRRPVQTNEKVRRDIVGNPDRRRHRITRV